MAASLLGTFGAAEGAGAPTTGSRTTTSGSLICAHGGANSGASGETLTFSDNKSNTITKALQHEIRPSTISYYLALGYNMAGTRGVTHTLSMNDNGGNSIGGTEWDGIAASPTIVTSTNSGNGTGPTASLTVAAASLFIGQCGYAATATTIAVSDGTQAIEIDEDNSRMSDNVAYEVGATGTPSLGWTLGATRDWITIGVSFTESGSTAYTLSCESGSFAISGTAASLEIGRKLSADSGSYAITGTSASLLSTRKITADSGSFTISGTAASLEAGYRIGADSGSYAISGTAASLEAGYKLSADTGAYTIAGTAASLEAGYKLSADSGSFVITGTAAGLNYGFRMTADAGSVLITGTSASLLGAFTLGLTGGSYAITGTAATLTHGGVLGTTLSIASKGARGDLFKRGARG